MPMVLYGWLPFPWLTPLLTKERQRLLLPIPPGHPNLTAFPLSLRRMHRPKTQAHSRNRNAFSKAKAYARSQCAFQSYPNNETAIVRAFRAASHDFQQDRRSRVPGEQEGVHGVKMDSALAWSSVYQDEKVYIGSRLHLPLRYTLLGSLGAFY